MLVSYSILVFADAKLDVYFKLCKHFRLPGCRSSNFYTPLCMIFRRKVVTLASPKLLSLEKAQIYLAFCSLIRNFAAMKQYGTILVVDDNPSILTAMHYLLDSVFERMLTLNQPHDILKVMAQEEINIVLLDMNFTLGVNSGQEGLLWLRTIRKQHPQTPVVLLTAYADVSLAVRGLKSGAADFITKPYDMPDVILARCERIIELQEDKNIIHDTERDTLTGLYSREYFIEYINQIEKYKADRKVDIININIDHFHLINELYGRKEGDNALISIAKSLLDYFSDRSGISCRSEADNFIIYCDHATDPKRVLEKVVRELSDISESNNIRLRMGVYSDADKSLMVENWFDRAKTACDMIRGDYSKDIEYYSHELYEQAKYQEKLINDIDDAISNKDLKVFFQPKYDVTGEEPKLRSAEALIRWIHPELGMISPGDFIPLFESNGLIQRLDRYVWEEAAKQVGIWKKEYGVSVPVSVNVSRMDIYFPGLKDNFVRLLKENGLEPNELMLEITESAYSENAEELITVVENLRKDGFMIEMDDFGTGYSSLNMITSIPIDALKLDMKFVRNMEKDEKSMKLVELVLEIAEFLQVPVIAEGVETENQLRLLKERNCDIIQGYYFSKPVPPEEFTKFFK